MDEQIIKDAYHNLPDLVREIIDGSEWETSIRKITNDFKLLINQGLTLEDETLLVMLGLKDSKSFVQNIASEAEIEPAIATQIGKAIEEEVFSKIREALQKETEMGPEEDLTLEETKVTDMPAAPTYIDTMLEGKVAQNEVKSDELDPILDSENVQFEEPVVNEPADLEPSPEPELDNELDLSVDNLVTETDDEPIDLDLEIDDQNELITDEPILASNAPEPATPALEAPEPMPEIVPDPIPEPEIPAPQTPSKPEIPPMEIPDQPIINKVPEPNNDSSEIINDIDEALEQTNFVNQKLSETTVATKETSDHGLPEMQKPTDSKYKNVDPYREPIE